MTGSGWSVGFYPLAYVYKQIITSIIMPVPIKWQGYEMMPKEHCSEEMCIEPIDNYHEL